MLKNWFDHVARPFIEDRREEADTSSSETITVQGAETVFTSHTIPLKRNFPSRHYPGRFNGYDLSHL